MKFSEFNAVLQSHVAKMTANAKSLYTIDTDKDTMWNLYLDSFPKGTNEVYRQRREFDCSCCRHFVKSFGNVVSIVNNKVISIWDFEVADTKYQTVINALSAYVKSYRINDAFVTKENFYGTEKNYEKDDSGNVTTWEHFYVKLPKALVSTSSDSVASITGSIRDTRNVFKRSLEEITQDSIETVQELTAQGSLYKGDEWVSTLKEFLRLHKEYHKLSNEDKETFCWEKSIDVGGTIGKIRNHSMGKLLTDISENKDLDTSVKSWEAMVAPTNYKRPKAIYTERMREDAKKTVIELGLMDSLGREYASLDDITINNILFANRDIKSKLTGADPFDMLNSNVVNPKSFDKIEEVNIDTFVKEILPNASNVSVFLENKHIGNMVSLIAPKVKDSTTMFKWDNNFSWAYKGNITDSMKDRVKALGGKVDGVFRFSIQWNTEGDNNNDFDAHAKEPNGNHVYFGLKRGHASSGELDVDIRSPIHEIGNGIAVENITYSNLSKMPKGVYDFYVHNFSHNGGRSGFTAEIEFNGNIYSYDYPQELKQGETVHVASVMYSEKGFEVIKSLPSSVSSKDIWNLKTNQFVPVTVAMLSPNYWNEQSGIGNKHYFFMLKDCVNTDSPNGFFNEFLKEPLMKHKHVFEALGSQMKVEDKDTQLSGIGFSSTQQNSLVCKVEGKFNRTIKIIF